MSEILIFAVGKLSCGKIYLFRFRGCVYDCYLFLQILAYYKGGSIIPRKERPRRASALMRNDPYTLYVALDANVSCSPFNIILNHFQRFFLQKSARGTLYTDDFESFEYREKKYLYLDFEFKNNTLRNRKIDNTDYKTEEWLERVVILGPPSGIKSATLKSKSN